MNDLDNVLYEVINEGGEKELGLVGREDDPRPRADEAEAAPDRASPATAPSDSTACSPARPTGSRQAGRDGYARRPARLGRRTEEVSLLDTDHIWGVGGNAAWVWKSFLRGHNPIFMDPYDGSVLGDPAIRRWEPIRSAMGAARQLASRLDLARMEPRNDLASTGYCLSEPGKAYAVYLPRGNEVMVDLGAAAGELEIEWIQPEGEKVVRGRIEGGAKRELSVPPEIGGAGAVILLRRPSPEEI